MPNIGVFMVSDQKQSDFLSLPSTVNKRILRRVSNQKHNNIIWSKNTWISILFLTIVFVILLVPNLSNFSGTATADFTSYGVKSSTVTIDGTINPNEYNSHFKDSKLDVELYSEHDASVIYFGIVCPEMGWCAIGFNDKGVTSGMGKADIKFGMMVNGSLQMTDRYASAVGATPTVDPTSNIVNYAGTRTGGKTTFEFSIQLNNGTEGGLDQNLVIGSSYTVIYAFHNTDVLEYHGHNRNQISFLISPDFK